MARRPGPLAALLAATLLLLPAAAGAGALGLAGIPRGGSPVVLPCDLPAPACDVLGLLCGPTGLLCPPPPPGHVDIYGNFPCTPEVCGFDPPTLVIQAGASVTWTNMALASTHTASSDQGLFDTDNLAPGQSSAPVAFPLAGTYPYHCNIHASMTGTIVVEG